MERISYSMGLSDVGGSKPEIRARVVMVDVKIAGINNSALAKTNDKTMVIPSAKISTAKENLRQKILPSAQRPGRRQEKMKNNIDKKRKLSNQIGSFALMPHQMCLQNTEKEK